jgi:hypothetical protein
LEDLAHHVDGLLAARSTLLGLEGFLALGLVMPFLVRVRRVLADVDAAVDSGPGLWFTRAARVPAHHTKALVAAAEAAAVAGAGAAAHVVAGAAASWIGSAAFLGGADAEALFNEANLVRVGLVGVRRRGEDGEAAGLEHVLELSERGEG